jgi:putative ABC transport system ATP-binding protein
VDELLRAVGLGPRRRALPSQLSGGEAARAGLAAALAVTPKILLADEPTGEVDAATEQQILELLERFRTHGGAAVIATHSETLAGWASRILRLSDGKVVGDE